MAFRFKVWNQGNDGQTMGIRVEDTTELARMASACDQPDIGGHWANLKEYLDAADIATGNAPPPYNRLVDVVWLNPVGYGSPVYFPGKRLVVIYTGNERQSGGFASQAYCVVDAQGYPKLASHHKDPIDVEYISHLSHDVLVVLP